MAYENYAQMQGQVLPGGIAGAQQAREATEFERGLEEIRNDIASIESTIRQITLRVIPARGEPTPTNPPTPVPTTYGQHLSDIHGRLALCAKVLNELSCHV